MEKKKSSTPEKIKNAAKSLFMTKGYAATTSREIAQKANSNLALLNYHFKSKKNLFEIIMREKFFTFFGAVLPIFDDNSTSLVQKFELLTNAYYNMLTQHPDLALFVVSEINKNPSQFVLNLEGIDFIKNSCFTQQVKKVNPQVEPENILINLFSLIIFPFIMQPVFNEVYKDQNSFLEQIMKERKQMIPQWMNVVLNVKKMPHEK